MEPCAADVNEKTKRFALGCKGTCSASTFKVMRAEDATSELPHALTKAAAKIYEWTYSSEVN